jgi:hypothetical protein
VFGVFAMFSKFYQLDVENTTFVALTKFTVEALAKSKIEK